MADTPHAEIDPNDEATAREAIASGARAAVRRATDLARDKAHPTLTALFCAGAAAPVIATALSVGALPAALLSVLGGVGGNILSNAVSDVISRFQKQPNDGDAHDAEVLLAARLDELTTANNEEAEALRREMAKLLAETKAIPEALESIVEAGREDLLSRLRSEIESFEPFAEFAPAVNDIREIVSRTDLTVLGMDGRARAFEDRTQANFVRMFTMLREFASHVNAQTTAPTTAQGEPIDEQSKPDAPYLGLNAFTEHDAAVYYGRERHSRRLLDHVADTLEAGNLSMVIASSGAGKTSLLRAGFLAAVGYGFLPLPTAGHWLGPERWPRVYMTPGKDPLWHLAQKLAELPESDSAPAVLSDLQQQPEHADWLVRQSLPDQMGGSRLVIVIDQFEELFTLTETDAAREGFMTAIASMTKGGTEAAALVVIGVRSDFLGDCGRFPLLSEALDDSPFVLTPMTTEEMRDAITGPAETLGLRIDDGLAEKILSDLSPSESGEFSPAALPLLSTAMHQIYANSEPGHLSKTVYLASGGVRKALQEKAEAVYKNLDGPEHEETDSLPGPRQLAAERLLRRMVRVSRNGRLVRLQVAIPDPLDPDTKAALHAFVQGRLIIRGQGTAEIAHDALLTHWDRLETWLEEDRTGFEACSRLVEDAKEWQSEKRDQAFLYQGSRLAAIDEHQDFWKRGKDRFDDEERQTADAFLAESRLVSTKRVRFRTMVTAGVAGLSIIVLIASVIAVVQSRALSEQEAETLSKLLAEQSREAGETDGELARLLAAAAWEADETDEARLALTNSVGNFRSGHLPTGNLSFVEDVEFSADGTWLAGVHGEAASIWDTETWSQRTIPTGMYGAASLVFSPDGTSLAIGGWNGVEIWDTASVTLVDQLVLNVGEGTNVVYSADGTRIAASDDNGNLRVWDTADYTEVVTVSTGRSLEDLAFSTPDGDVMAISEALFGDGEEPARLQVWSAETGEVLQDNAIAEEEYSSEWSMDVVPTDPMQLLLCDENMCLNESQGSDTAWVKLDVSIPAAFSPDADLVASSSTDSIALWEPETREQVTLLQTDIVPRSLAFSPDGKTLVGGG